MESVWTAAKNFSRKLFDRSGSKLRNWSLRLLRSLIWRADEWCWRQEQALKPEVGDQKLDPEYDPAASRIRERAHQVMIHDGCTTPGKTTPLDSLVRRSSTRRRMTAAEFDARFAGVRQ